MVVKLFFVIIYEIFIFVFDIMVLLIIGGVISFIKKISVVLLEKWIVKLNF